jgi:hypothetical protein
VPKGLLKGVTVNELPEEVTFEICNRIENSLIVLDPIPMKMTRTGDSKVEFLFEDSGTRKYWDGGSRIQAVHGDERKPSSKSAIASWVT